MNRVTENHRNGIMRSPVYVERAGERLFEARDHDDAWSRFLSRIN